MKVIIMEIYEFENGNVSVLIGVLAILKCYAFEEENWNRWEFFENDLHVSKSVGGQIDVKNLCFWCKFNTKFLLWLYFTKKTTIF